MGKMSPEVLFVLVYLVSAFSGLGGVLLSSKPISIRIIFGTILVYGGLGSGLGMIGYEYLGGKDAQWKVIACGFLVGTKALKIRDVTRILRKVLEINGNGNGPSTTDSHSRPTDPPHTP
jgi:hypothetical protein